MEARKGVHNHTLCREICSECLLLEAWYTYHCRFLAASSELGNNISYKGHQGSPHSLDSSTTSTVTGSEEIGPLRDPGSTQHSQMQVITPLYSLATSSSSVSVGGSQMLRLPSPQVSHPGSPRTKEVPEISPKLGRGGLSGRHSQSIRPTSNHSGRHHYMLKSSPSHSSVDVKSTVTTSSEIDFRNNLANLDADIARLQMQFKVARQSPQIQ